MIFLEFVCQQLMGPPTWRRGGRTGWNCPSCNDKTAFGTLPHLPEFKDRVQCFRCNFRGDEYDLLKVFQPYQSWPERRTKMATYFANYKTGELHRANLIHRGQGTRKTPKPAKEKSDVEMAWAGLMKEFCEEETGLGSARQILNETRQYCQANNVSMEELLEYWNAFEDWVYDSQLRHVAECDDPECDAAVCLVRKGLPPLTEAEIAQARMEAAEMKRQQRAKIAKAMKKGKTKLKAAMGVKH